jgi:hypothetical protein
MLNGGAVSDNINRENLVYVILDTESSLKNEFGMS